MEAGSPSEQQGVFGEVMARVTAGIMPFRDVDHARLFGQDAFSDAFDSVRLVTVRKVTLVKEAEEHRHKRIEDHAASGAAVASQQEHCGRPDHRQDPSEAFPARRHLEGHLPLSHLPYAFTLTPGQLILYRLKDLVTAPSISPS